jgi:alcohol dehydrogenase
MRQLTYVKPKTLKWWDVPEPKLGSPIEALVRPFVAARCDGDSLFLRHNFEKVIRLGAILHAIDGAFARPGSDPFHGPFAYGHECVAEVVAVGESVRSHAVGDVVVVPWSVSCGSCPLCQLGFTSNCERAKTPVAAFGFGDAIGGHGGMVSDLVRVPYADAMLVPVPRGVDPLALASASDNIPDAYRAVGPHLERMPGAPVLINGGGAKSIGLYAAAIALAMGSSRVDYVDTDVGRLRTAEALGVNAVPRAARADVGLPLLAGGYPIAVDASSTTTGLEHALTALSPGGVCTGVGFYIRRGTPLPLWKMYFKSATLHIGVSHPRTHLPAVLRLIESGRFDPRRINPLVADWDDAPRVLLERVTKVIVRRAPVLART